MSEIIGRELELVPTGKLRTHPRNPRKGDVDAIRESIDANGFFAPIVAQRSTGYVLAGNHRLVAAVDAGLVEVPVVWVDVDDDRAARILLADNRTADRASWADAELAAILQDLEATDQGLRGVGFDDRDLAELLARIDAEPATPLDSEIVEDDVPDRPETSRVELGDVWKLGGHRLWCGDATDVTALTRFLGRRRVDMVLTDPPYAIYGSSSGLSSEITDDRIVRPFFESVFRLAGRHVKTFGHVYVFCDWRSWAAIWDAAKRAEVTAKNLLVWDKGGGGLGTMYANTYELVGFFARLPKQQVMGHRPAGQRPVHKPNLLRFDRAHGAERLHNAAKPIALLAELIGNSSDDGGVVLDPFVGSGSTLIACEQLGRACLAVDIDPGWCDVAIARWERLTGGEAAKEEA